MRTNEKQAVGVRIMVMVISCAPRHTYPMAMSSGLTPWVGKTSSPFLPLCSLAGLVWGLGFCWLLWGFLGGVGAARPSTSPPPPGRKERWRCTSARWVSPWLLCLWGFGSLWEQTFQPKQPNGCQAIRIRFGDRCGTGLVRKNIQMQMQTQWDLGWWPTFSLSARSHFTPPLFF